jgi:hypothetical protein
MSSAKKKEEIWNIFIAVQKSAIKIIATRKVLEISCRDCG